MIPKNWVEKPPPHNEGKFFDIGSIHFRQFPATLVFVAEKPPPSRMRENCLKSDLSISGNFQQLWFLWQKIPPPPPQDEGTFFNIGSIHFRQFPATLGFWQKSPPPSGWGNIFWHWIYPFQAISSKFGFCGRKAPPPNDEGNFFDIRSIHFRQFRATLVFVAGKPPPQGWGKFFWHWIHHTRTSTLYERLFAGNANPSSYIPIRIAWIIWNCLPKFPWVQSFGTNLKKDTHEARVRFPNWELFWLDNISNRHFDFRKSKRTSRVKKTKRSRCTNSCV